MFPARFFIPIRILINGVAGIFPARYINIRPSARLF